MISKQRLLKLIVACLIETTAFVCVYFLLQLYWLDSNQNIFFSLYKEYFVFLYLSCIYVYMAYDEQYSWIRYSIYAVLGIHAIRWGRIIAGGGYTSISVRDIVIFVVAMSLLFLSMRITYVRVRRISISICLIVAVAQIVYIVVPVYHRELDWQGWYISQQEELSPLWETGSVDQLPFLVESGEIAYKTQLRDATPWVRKLPYGSRILLYPQTVIHTSPTMTWKDISLKQGKIYILQIDSAYENPVINLIISGDTITIREGIVEVYNDWYKLSTSYEWKENEKNQTAWVWYYVKWVRVYQWPYDMKESGSTQTYLEQFQTWYIADRTAYFARQMGSWWAENAFVDIGIKQLINVLYNIYPSYYFDTVQRYYRFRKYVPVSTDSIAPTPTDVVIPDTTVVLQDGATTVWQDTKLYQWFSRLWQ